VQAVGLASGAVRYHLAQFNHARARAALDDPVMAEFVEGLDRVNALADAAPGFVWRLQSTSGSATDIRAFEDPAILLNYTMWESVEALKAFTYTGAHVEFFRRRRGWFEPDPRALVMWWVRSGHVPDVAEALARLDFLERHGPSPYAFTFGSVAEPLVLEPVTLGDPDVVDLIGQLNAELHSQYPEPGSNHFRLDPEEVVAGRGVMFVVRWRDEPVACGAIRMIGTDTAEVKRMYVRPTARGQKIGAAVLHRLETEARALGATRLALETGPDSVNAITVYERAGFVRIPCWGEYAGAPASYCMEKTLSR
jgi:GNAT superfamily N-acetyltransferase